MSKYESLRPWNMVFVIIILTKLRLCVTSMSFFYSLNLKQWHWQLWAESDKMIKITSL